MTAVSSHLNPEHLLAAAAREAGLEDYGNLDFFEPLGLFLQSAEAEAGLGEAGLAGLRADMTRLLVNRLA